MEERLAQLREGNRLGMHMWESRHYVNEKLKPYDFPDYSHYLCTHLSADQIEDKLIHYRSPPNPNQNQYDPSRTYFVSASLIPCDNPKSGALCSVPPYSMYDEMYPQVGYLLNFSQPGEALAPKHSAKILRVNETVLSSGYGWQEKNLRLPGPKPDLWKSSIDGLDESYGKFSQQEFIQIIGRDAKGKLSKQQLNSLGNAYQNHKFNLEFSIHTNEVVCAMSEEHIEAIVVSVYDIKDPEKQTLEDAYANAIGALGGLQHLRAGMDLPVVRYQVNEAQPPDPDMPRKGECRYMAQGKMECKQMLIGAMATLSNHKDYLGTHPVPASYEHLCQAAAEALGMERETLDGQIAERMAERQRGRV